MPKNTNGPFVRHKFIPPAHFERIAREALVEVGLFPDSPDKVRIDRFAEKKWGICEDYIDLPDDTLGRAGFNENGLCTIELNRRLEEDPSTHVQRRLRSTLAHEIGHGLVHADLWAETIQKRKEGDLLFEMAIQAPSILEFGFSCRGETIEGEAQKPQDFEWWEYQANQLMSSLLLPWNLVMEVAVPFREGLCSSKPVERSIAFDTLKHDVADVFDVNPVMAKIRLQKWADELLRSPELPLW